MKTCDQCVSMRVNGIFIHEEGCPNDGSKWDRENERWVKMVKCFDCGCDVEEGETCPCMELEDFDPEDDEIDEMVNDMENEE